MSTETDGPGRLEPWAERACDQIDAGFFSGDTFHYPETIERIEWYLGRWSRELERVKKWRAEEARENGAPEPAGMNFEQAMTEVAKGGKVRRRAWKAKGPIALQESTAIVFSEGLNFRRQKFLCWPNMSGRFETPHGATAEDIAATDWESVT